MSLITASIRESANKLVSFKLDKLIENWKKVLPETSENADTIMYLCKIAGKVKFGTSGFDISSLEKSIEKATSSGRTGTKSFKLITDALDQIKNGKLSVIHKSIGQTSWGAFAQAYKGSLGAAFDEEFKLVAPNSVILFSQAIWRGFTKVKAYTSWVTMVELISKTLTTLDVKQALALKGNLETRDEQSEYARLAISLTANKTIKVPESSDFKTESTEFGLFSCHYVPMIYVLMAERNAGKPLYMSTIADCIKAFNNYLGKFFRMITAEDCKEKDNVQFYGVRKIEYAVSLAIRAMKKNKIPKSAFGPKGITLNSSEWETIFSKVSSKN